MGAGHVSDFITITILQRMKVRVLSQPFCFNGNPDRLSLAFRLFYLLNCQFIKFFSYFRWKLKSISTTIKWVNNWTLLWFFLNYIHVHILIYKLNKLFLFFNIIHLFNQFLVLLVLFNSKNKCHSYVVYLKYQ